MPVCQCERSFGIGLDGHTRNLGRVRWVDNRDGMDMGLEFIVDLERVRGRFKHNRIGRAAAQTTCIGGATARNAATRTAQRPISSGQFHLPLRIAARVT